MPTRGSTRLSKFLSPACRLGFLLPAILFASDCNAAATKKVNGNVYTPAVELRNDDGRSVLIAGMIHFGPAAFYERVSALMRDWIASSGGKTKVLREFPVCTGSVYVSTSLDLSKDALAEAAAKVGSVTPANFVNLPEDDLHSVLAALKLEKKACVTDVDGITLRPSYVVDRNRDWCEQGKTHEGACQWLDLHYPSGPNVELTDADLKMDDYPAGMQVVGATMYTGWQNASALTDDQMNQLYAPSEYVIMHFRIDLLSREMERAWATGAKRVVLPWGAAHAKDLRDLIVKQGFHQSKVQDILYMQPSDVGHWSMLDDDYNDQSLTEHYDLEN